MNRLRRAWRVLTGRDELEVRALSFACAALQHLEAQPTWGLTTCQVIASEAVHRKLGAQANLGFELTVDAVVLSSITPRPHHGK